MKWTTENISYNLVIKKYLETGNLNSAKKGGSPNTKCTNEIKTFMEGLLREECTRTLKYLQQSI